MRKFGLWVLALLLTVFVSAEASAQRRVTGKVTGSSGEPVQAASVNVQGTTIGAYTQEDGRFTLNNVPAGAQVLVVRRIGYRRVSTPLSGAVDQMDIRMEKDVLQLETQVVTGTATTVSSANAANAVAVVTSEQLNRVQTSTFEAALQGKVPGAVISQNSGAPGGGMQIQLRGVTSINASSSPLYVIDGILANNSQIGTGLNSVTAAGGGITNSQDQPANRMADINPADIETIEVLKGASAGAIYGSKASNGVIIITTKKGASGRPSAAVTQRIGQFKLGHKLGLRCFSQAEAIAQFGITAAEFDGCHDFEEEFYGGNPLSYETDMSLRGGSGGTTFYVGGLAKRDNAIQVNSYYQKQSLTANLSQLLGSRLTIRANNEFVHSLTDRGIAGNDNADVSPGAVFSETPTFFDLKSRAFNPWASNGSNPFQNADLVKNPEDVYRYIGSINTTLSAFSSQRQTLDFTFIGGIDTYSFNSHLVAPPEAYYEPSDGQPGTIVTNKTQNVNANLNLSGAHKFIADPFTATTSFGLRQERRQIDLVYNQGRNIPSGVTNVNFGVNQAVLESQSLIKDFAYYAQEELLAFSERLLLTAAINSERSSVNGDDKKFYNYPKFAASYRLPYLPKFTDELKLRIAYGKAGNQPNYGVKFTTLPISVIEGQLAAQPSTIAGASDIRPETSIETEGGIDAQFGGGRVAIDATVFRKNVEDLILSAAVAGSSGFTTRNFNAGALKNTGTEIGLNITPIQRDNFSWVSRTTYAKVNGLITRLDVPCFNGGSFFSLRYGAPYVCQGFSASDAQAYNGYDTTFADPVNRTGFVRRALHIENYESAPKFTMGFSNEVNVGPVRLYGLVDWRNGGRVANLTNSYFDGNGLPALLADTLAQQQRTLNQFGKTSSTRDRFNSYLEEAGFVKLREVSAGFALPKAVVQGIFPSMTQDVRLEISGRNLKTWTKYTGYDPEVSNFSNQNIGRFQDVTPYPASKSIFVSLSANF